MACYITIHTYVLLFLLLLITNVNAQIGDFTLTGFKFSNKISNAFNTTFLSPADIITDYSNGLMYVADKFKNRIVYCYLNSTDNCREYTMTWHTYNSACTNGQCNSVGSTCCSYPYFLKDPTGVAVDTLGNMWIADRINNRIVYCSGLLGGNCQLFTKKVASASTTGLSNPYSIVLGMSGSIEILYISDLYNDRIIACSGLSNLQTEGYQGCSVYTTSYTHNSAITTFNEVRGLALDGSYIYICDTKNRRIVVCTGIADTATSCQTYAHGYGTGKAFGAPYGTARSLGYLYFADWSNNTVGYCVGDLTGACYTYTNTAAGTAFQRPSGIGITPVTFEIFISDATNNRIVYIKAFTPGPTVVPTTTPTVVPSQPTHVPTAIPTAIPSTATPTVVVDNDDDAALIGGIVGGVIGALLLLFILLSLFFYLGGATTKKEKPYRTFEMVSEVVQEEKIENEAAVSSAPVILPPAPPPVKMLNAKEKEFVCDEP